jgi:hypothetical protein
MAATYVVANLKTSAKDRARFTLADVGALTDDAGAAVWLLQDEEIQAYVDMYGFAEGVAQCAERLAALAAQEPTKFKDETGLEVDWGKRWESWMETARKLRSGVASVKGALGSTVASGRVVGPDMTGVRP